MKIIIVLTSHSELGDTGKKTGFWVEELAAPYYELADAGAEITLASPKGRQPQIDPKSGKTAAQTQSTQRFDKDEQRKQKLAHTLKLGSVKASDYDAVFYPGGHGPLRDLTNDAKQFSTMMLITIEEGKRTQTADGGLRRDVEMMTRARALHDICELSNLAGLNPAEANFKY
jgi:hypothetical protein